MMSKNASSTNSGSDNDQFVSKDVQWNSFEHDLLGELQSYNTNDSEMNNNLGQNSNSFGRNLDSQNANHSFANKEQSYGVNEFTNANQYTLDHQGMKQIGRTDASELYSPHRQTHGGRGRFDPKNHRVKGGRGKKQNETTKVSKKTKGVATTSPNTKKNHKKNSSSRKNNNQKNEPTRKLKDIDINMYEYEVLSFHQNMEHNLSIKINCDVIFRQFVGVLKNLASELKENCMIMKKQQQRHNSKQSKIKGVDVVDRSLFSLVQGLKYLDFNWKSHYKNVNDSNSEIGQEIHTLWNEVMNILQLVSVFGAKGSKKTSDFHHSHDYFAILMEQVTSLLDLKNHDVMVSTLKCDHDSTKVIMFIRSLALLVKAFGCDLNGENDIGFMVGTVLLPILEIDLIQSRDNIHMVLKLITSALDCLVEVLVWKHHSSAILSPLVVGVGSSGQERLHQNPLRVQLLQSLIGLLNTEEFIDSEHNHFLCSVCKVLYTSLDKMYAIELSHKNKNKTEKNKIVIEHTEVASIFKWVQKSLQLKHSNASTYIGKGDEESLLWHSLRLLESITKLYPKGCAQYWALFLPQSAMSPKSASSGPTTLVSIISNDEDGSDDNKIMATKASKEFIGSLPLDLWSKSGYLMNRVETSLLELLLCFNRQLSKRQSKEYMNALCVTAGILVTEIPYSEYKGLISSAESLLNQLADCYIEYDSEKNLSDCLAFCGKVITDCFGGKETPQGDRKPLPIPTENWLRGASSQNFVEQVFTTLHFIDPETLTSKNSIASMKVTLITRMVRSVAWIVIDNETRLTNFITLSQKLIDSETMQLKLTGVKLLSSFLEGKRNTEQLSGNSKIGSNSMYTIYTILSSLLKVNASPLRLCTLTAFSHLQYIDWLVLLNQQPNPIQLMLPICLEYSGDEDANVRAEACRSLGNMVTECLESFDNLYHDELKSKIHDIVVDAIKVTASAVEDSTAGVRSMALFAMGNIALAVGMMDHVDNEFVQKLPLLQLSEVTFKHLVDSDEKVVGNAIRTLGHLCNLLYNNHSIEVNLHTYEKMTWVKLCGLISQELSSKIELSVTDVVDALNQRSWRQRSHAKRHAWGSCQALSSILCCKVAEEETNRAGVKAAIHSLIKCIRNAQLMNEKIVYGALSTLVKIPREIYILFSDLSSLSGLCFAVCLIKLENDTAYKQPIYDLMKHLLNVMNYFDFVSCLNCEDLSENNVEYLYNWMVSNEVQAQHFESVAGAFEFTSFNSNVSLFQKFRSRAEKKRRNENTIVNSNGFAIDEDDDDEDEL